MKHSFANLSNTGNKDNYFLNGEVIQYSVVDQRGVDVDACRKASGRLKEVWIGTRGNWWPPYALFVTQVDAIADDRVGGFMNTKYGAKLIEKYDKEYYAAQQPRDKNMPRIATAKKQKLGTHDSQTNAASKGDHKLPKNAPSKEAPSSDRPGQFFLVIGYEPQPAASRAQSLV